MAGRELPPARTPGRYHVAVVCLGNICRSPMAQVVLTERVADAGLADRVTVSSAGTGDWHVGDPMDRRAAATLTRSGYDATRHRARQWTGRDPVDLVLAMDAQNHADITDLEDPAEDLAEDLAEDPAEDPAPAERAGRVRLFREFDPVEPGSDVPDPYYGGDSGFEEVLAMVERTAEALVQTLERERPWSGGGERVS
ncbi:MULTISPECIES: low molecular weight protein-tyrosine-phosphatase [unclassified Nocardioides]|uniref:low molecular weight protein-tyrosine-phosphatase n=1 Tax=unclassified Nocardioides TaxID=2615069 RepID=UPI0000571384|nr:MULTISPECIES: low molecular weight protein-tyrosine-phosphatase [unclassified Nocardioides]ABL84014.1 protein tyrosine phosphatase [Nocardioides sp. JS614]